MITLNGSRGWRLPPHGICALLAPWEYAYVRVKGLALTSGPSEEIIRPHVLLTPVGRKWDRIVILGTQLPRLIQMLSDEDLQLHSRVVLFQEGVELTFHTPGQFRALLKSYSQTLTRAFPLRRREDR